MQLGDLHIHTAASDGFLTPDQVACRASEGNLDFFAVTDHNAVCGIEPARSALPSGGPRLINGVELSAQPDDENEIHILGYGFDPQNHQLREVCREIVARKKEQILQIVHRMRREGVDIDAAGLLTKDDETYTGRPVIAQHLVSRGVVRSRGSAFGRYLGSGAPTFVPMRGYSPLRCIEALRGAGGLAVLAHPTIGMVDRWLEPLAGMGLQGIEAYRPRLAGNEQLYIEKAAEHFGLFVTGGSDWHGRSKEDPIGAFAVPEKYLEGFFDALQRCSFGD